MERFERHESTAAHHEAVEMLVCKTRDVGEMLSDSYALETCRKMLSVIISFLGWQGLALRGHKKKSTSDRTEGGELDSNLTLTVYDTSTKGILFRSK